MYYDEELNKWVPFGTSPVKNAYFKLRPIMEWIKCSERLPENDRDVLIYNPKDGIGIGEFDADVVSNSNSGWESYYDWAPYMSPIFWMPLPKPPKED